MMTVPAEMALLLDEKNLPAEISQRFHDGQRDAARDGRTGKRQRHRPEGVPGGTAKRTAGVGIARRLLKEGRAGKQVDVRIEHEDEHGRRTAQRADIREPVITWSPTRKIAQRALHESGMRK